MECKKCGAIWKNTKEKPVECPYCKAKDYNKPRVYTKRVPINYTEQTQIQPEQTTPIINTEVKTEQTDPAIINSKKDKPSVKFY